MSYTLGISCILFAVLLGGGLLYLYRQIVKRRERQNIEIPAFLRRENAGNSTDVSNNSDIYPTTRIHPWGKVK